jgi:hypothetical protein
MIFPSVDSKLTSGYTVRPAQGKYRPSRRITDGVTEQRDFLPHLSPLNRYGLKTIGDFDVIDVLGSRIHLLTKAISLNVINKCSGSLPRGDLL